MKNNLKYLFSILLVILFQLNLSGQNIDSLKRELSSTKSETKRFILLMNIGDYFQYSSVDSTIYYHRLAHQVSIKLNNDFLVVETLLSMGLDNYLLGKYDEAKDLNTKGLVILKKYLISKDIVIQKKAQKFEVDFLENMALIYTDVSDYENAFSYYFMALEFYKKNNIKEDQGDVLNNIAGLYTDKGEYPKGLEYSFMALKINEQLGNKKAQSKSLVIIGNIYAYQNDHKKALNYFEKALKISEEIGDKYNEGYCLGNIGTVYLFGQQNHSKSLEYYFRALVISESIHNLPQIITNLSNIGNVYSEQGDYTKALNYNLKALKIAEENNLKSAEVSPLINIGSQYTFFKKFDEAEKYILKALKISMELNSLNDIIDSHDRLVDIYEQSSKPKLALVHYRKYITYRDSVFNKENTKKSLQQELKFAYDKKASIDSIKVFEERKITMVQLEQEKTKSYALYGGLSLVLVFAGFMVNRFRVTNKQKQLIELKEKETQQQNIVITQQKHLVEEKHKEITDSINYAERIQRSFLASKEILDENLNDYFVLFKPKDVVSGDFYWASMLNNGNFALVTADSTGHGVPGAIMSLLNITSLEKAIEDINHPNEILNHTRITIINRLKKDGSEHGGKDGMDASLIVFDFKQNQLHIAAANNPVWIVRESNLIEVKPDKMPVGKHDKDSTPFNQQTIDIQKGDVIYAITDGYPDQFGGEKGKKFMSKNLKEFLQANAHLPMEEQKALLEITFKNWVGNLEQVDDVTVIGIRF